MGSMIYNLYREQQLKCSIDEAWQFFASPQNLPELAPKEMDFKVLTNADEMLEIYSGMRIDYLVRPLFGIRISWKSELRDVVYKKSFSDFQYRGPFRMWQHHHEFIENEEGVLMKDTLTYEMKWGMFGQLLNTLLIHDKLNYIFDNRQKVIAKLFGGN